MPANVEEPMRRDDQAFCRSHYKALTVIRLRGSMDLSTVQDYHYQSKNQQCEFDVPYLQILPRGDQSQLRDDLFVAL